MKTWLKTWLKWTPAAGAMLALLASAAAGVADDYPSRPIRLIVPYLAGGSGDIVARVLADELSKNMGQPFVVDNRPGAGGNIGMDQAAKSPPDGYTLVISSVPMAINVTLYGTLPFDTMTAFAPIATIVDEPNILVVGPDVPVSSVKELIALANKEPGKLLFASSGNGTVTHLSGEMFRKMANVDIRHIPYRGVMPALTDTMTGQTTMFFAGQGPVSSFVKSGKLKALATSETVPAPLFPELPKIADDLPGYDATVWIGIMAPAGMPKPIMDRLVKEIGIALQAPAVRSKLEAMGYRIAERTPEAFKRLIEDDIRKWGSLVKETGAKPQ